VKNLRPICLLLLYRPLFYIWYSSGSLEKQM